MNYQYTRWTPSNGPAAEATGHHWGNWLWMVTLVALLRFTILPRINNNWNF